MKVSFALNKKCILFLVNNNYSQSSLLIAFPLVRPPGELWCETSKLELVNHNHAHNVIPSHYGGCGHAYVICHINATTTTNTNPTATTTTNTNPISTTTTDTNPDAGTTN